MLVVAQIHHSTRVAAIDAARQFIADTRQHWGACLQSAGKDPFDIEKFRFDLGQFIAQLELNSAAIDEISFPDRLHLMVERTIVSFVNEMISAGYSPYLNEIFSDPTVCPCLKSFCLQRRSIFQDGDKVMEAFRIDHWRYV